MTEDSKFESFYQKMLLENKDILQKYKKEAVKQRIKAVIIPKMIFIGIYIGIITYAIIEGTKRWGFENFIKDIISPSMIMLVIISSALYYLCFGWIFILTRGMLTVKESQYNNIFKKSVVRLLFELFEQKVWYEPNGEIKFENYLSADFENDLSSLSSKDYKNLVETKRVHKIYFSFKSDDVITGKTKNGYDFLISDICLKSVGDYAIKENMIFQGIFIRIDVPKTNDGYLIISNTKIINYEKYRIDMDYMEFQEKFNVYGTNKIIAMQLLTADIMQLLIEFSEKVNIDFQIKYINNSIYIRFKSGGMFEIESINKGVLDKQTIYKYYKMIDTSFEISNQMSKLINEVEF